MRQFSLGKSNAEETTTYTATVRRFEFYIAFLARRLHFSYIDLLHFHLQDCIAQQDAILKDYEDVISRLATGNDTAVDLKLKPSTYGPISHRLRKARLKELRLTVRRKESEMRAIRREILAVRAGKRDSLLLASRPSSNAMETEESNINEEEETDTQDTQSTTKEKLQMLVSKLSGMKMAKPFLHPVSAEQVPSYASIIKNPMDLGTISSQIEDGTITTPYQCLRAILLMCKNGAVFNPPGTEMHNTSNKIRDTAVSEAEAIFGSGSNEGTSESGRPSRSRSKHL
jgi:hypothetical protein